jgi:hypothetical protein
MCSLAAAPKYVHAQQSSQRLDAAYQSRNELTLNDIVSLGSHYRMLPKQREQTGTLLDADFLQIRQANHVGLRRLQVRACESNLLFFVRLIRAQFKTLNFPCCRFG